jgi:hypothetical protein
MHDLKRHYLHMLATLYWEVEAWLDEFGDGSFLPSARCEQMWARFEALRERFAALRRDVTGQLGAHGTRDVQETAVRAFLYELERMLDVEHDGDDWETQVGAAVISAEGRICDEARQVERWG